MGLLRKSIVIRVVRSTASLLTRLADKRKTTFTNTTILIFDIYKHKIIELTNDTYALTKVPGNNKLPFDRHEPETALQRVSLRTIADHIVKSR